MKLEQLEKKGTTLLVQDVPIDVDYMLWSRITLPDQDVHLVEAYTLWNRKRNRFNQVTVSVCSQEGQTVCLCWVHGIQVRNGLRTMGGKQPETTEKSEGINGSKTNKKWNHIVGI